jgi:hypothetical protein
MHTLPTALPWANLPVRLTARRVRCDEASSAATAAIAATHYQRGHLVRISISTAPCRGRLASVWQGKNSRGPLTRAAFARWCRTYGAQHSMHTLPTALPWANLPLRLTARKSAVR